MRLLARLLPLVLVLSSGAAARAQGWVRFGSDGAWVEGRVLSGNPPVVETTFGRRTVNDRAEAPSAVKDRGDAGAELLASYDAQVQALPAGFLSGHVALARWCVDQGLLSKARECLEHVFRRDPVHGEGLALLRDIRAVWELDSRGQAPSGRLRREYIQDLFSRHAARDITAAVDAWLQSERLTDEETLRPALKALKSPDAGVRWLGAKTLARHRDRPERIVPLYRRSLMDRAPAVRLACVQSLGVTGDPVFARLYAKNLENPQQALRITAAEALGALGMEEGVSPLLARFSASFKPAPPPDGHGFGTRGYVAVTTQRAFVKDFDVEIAQAAVIADPVVDIVTEGAVLDVKVVGISVERAAYRTALAGLAGHDFGNDLGAWSRWFEENHQR